MMIFGYNVVPSAVPDVDFKCVKDGESIEKYQDKFEYAKCGESDNSDQYGIMSINQINGS